MVLGACGWTTFIVGFGVRSNWYSVIADIFSYRFNKSVLVLSKECYSESYIHSYPSLIISCIMNVNYVQWNLFIVKLKGDQNKFLISNIHYIVCLQLLLGLAKYTVLRHSLYAILL